MGQNSQPGRTEPPTTVARKSDRELIVTRVFDAPVRVVFDAWTKPELFKRWWAPKSMATPMLSCEMDARTGGGYRIVFGRDASQSMAFFGKYLEVSPPSRLVWTNEESEPAAVTTVTFEEKDGRTRVVLQDLHPSTEACDEAVAGMEGAAPEQFAQLDELLASLGASV